MGTEYMPLSLIMVLFIHQLTDYPGQKKSASLRYL
jgi:hypothetical protein